MFTRSCSAENKNEQLAENNYIFYSSDDVLHQINIVSTILFINHLNAIKKISSFTLSMEY